MCLALAFGNEEATSDLCRVQTGEQGAKPKLRGGRGLISGIRGMETEVGGRWSQLPGSLAEERREQQVAARWEGSEPLGEGGTGVILLSFQVEKLRLKRVPGLVQSNEKVMWRTAWDL